MSIGLVRPTISANGVRVTVVVLPADQHAGLAIAQRLHGVDAELGRQHAVEGGRWCAAHDVAERRGAQLEARLPWFCLEIGQDLRRVFLDTFGDHDDGVRLAALDRPRAAAAAISAAGTSNSGVEITSAPPARPAIIAI